MQALVRRWYQPPRLVWLLMPLAWIYALAAGARRALYRCDLLPRTRLPIPLVVIGNITAGGTGKTPLTRWLAERLISRGWRPGIVARAYAARAQTPRRVRALDEPGMVGDEAVLLATVLPCPVWSGRRRAQTARALSAGHPEVDVVLCDDGLQHYALARDMEIAVVDGARGFGNALPLPAGPLREPPSRLREVDAIVVNGPAALHGLPQEVARFAMTLVPAGLRNLRYPERTVAWSELRGRVVAIAGIGNPERFFDALRALGVSFESRAFPDHHAYRAADLSFPGADAILMTEKDAIKCAAFADPRMWAVPVSVTVDEALLERVLERLARAAQRASPSRLETRLPGA